MKKIVGLLIVVLVIFGAFLGYKVVYKVSPRDFITKDTRIVYANEGINNKDFSPVLNFIEDEKQRDEVASKLKELKYISKLYIFSDKEFYEYDVSNFTGVVDTGYWYFIVLKEIANYFEYSDGIYILKAEVKKRYLPNFKGDIYMKPYRGLLIFSTGKKNLKDFIEKDGKYLYNKEIESALDMKRDNLFGTLIYNNTGADFYGVDFLVGSATISDKDIVSDVEIVLNKSEDNVYKTTKENRELVKYLNENDIYLSVDDFSKLDYLIFNPLVMGGQKIDRKSVFNFWKGLLGIDIEKILQEIDGELIWRVPDSTLITKFKADSPESKKLINLFDDKNSIFYQGKSVQRENGIVVLGSGELVENRAPYQIPAGTFLYGRFNFKYLGFEGVDSSIDGRGDRIRLKSRFAPEVVKELLRGY